MKPVLAILTALPKENGAVQLLLRRRRRQKIRGDPTIYTLGTIRGKLDDHVVVHASLSKYANNLAAVTTTNILRSFPSVRDVIMVGIAAGVPRPGRPDGHVRLGDVVISSGPGVVQFDLGAATSRGFEVRSTAPPPSASLLQAVNMLESEMLSDQFSWRNWYEIFLRKARVKRPNREPKRDFHHPIDELRQRGLPRIFRGKIGASNTLMKNARRRDKLARSLGLLALEMEGSGVADASWEGGAGYLVIRGICDYADSNKNDAWQAYAAHVAASYLGALLFHLPPKRHSTTFEETAQMRSSRNPDVTAYIQREPRTVNQLRRLWGFRDPHRIYIVSGAIHGVNKFVKSVVLAGPDAQAANALVASAALLYPNADIQHVFSSRFPPELYKEHLVVVGGPVNNDCAATLLSKLHKHICFKNKFDLLACGSTYETTYSRGRPIRDHGAIVRIVNPFDTSKDVIMTLGCDTYGVLAASIVMTMKPEVQDIRTKLFCRIKSKRSVRLPNYLAVVECDILGHSVTNVSLKSLRSIDVN